MNHTFEAKLTKAWELFEKGDLKQSESLYLECLDTIDKSNVQKYSSILMGLIYVECFAEKYDIARQFAEELLHIAQNPEEQHIYLHQQGMVERMASNYAKALELFDLESEIILENFPNDFHRIATNLYEKAYILSKCKEFQKAIAEMKRAIHYAEQSNDLTTIACTYRGMAEILSDSGNHCDARQYFKKAIQSFEKEGSPSSQYAIAEIKEMMPELSEEVNKNIKIK